MEQDPYRTLNYDPAIDEEFDYEDDDDGKRANKLATDIDRCLFLRVCNRDGAYFSNRFILYTDWIVKLQEVKRPVEEWISSRLPFVKWFWILTRRDDTQDLIARIRWPEWTADQLQRVGVIEIWRHAIMQLPPWIFKMPQLHHLKIQEDIP